MYQPPPGEAQPELHHHYGDDRIQKKGPPNKQQRRASVESNKNIPNIPPPVFSDPKKEFVILPSGLFPMSERGITEKHCNDYREYYHHIVPLTGNIDYHEYNGNIFRSVLKNMHNDFRLIARDVLADMVINAFCACGAREKTGQRCPSSIEECLALLRSDKMKDLAKTNPFFPLRLTFEAVHLVADSPEFARRLAKCFHEYGRGNYQPKHEDENNLKYCKKDQIKFEFRWKLPNQIKSRKKIVKHDLLVRTRAFASTELLRKFHMAEMNHYHMSIRKSQYNSRSKMSSAPISLLGTHFLGKHLKLNEKKWHIALNPGKFGRNPAPLDVMRTLQCSVIQNHASVLSEMAMRSGVPIDTAISELQNAYELEKRSFIGPGPIAEGMACMNGTAINKVYEWDGWDPNHVLYGPGMSDDYSDEYLDELMDIDGFESHTGKSTRGCFLTFEPNISSSSGISHILFGPKLLQEAGVSQANLTASLSPVKPMHGIDGDGILPGDANMAQLLLDFSKEALAPSLPTKAGQSTRESCLSF